MTMMNIVEPRLRWFVRQMKEKLKQNEYKSDWRKLSTKKNMKAIKDELRELSFELFGYDENFNNGDSVIDECADVANRAMMLADLVKSQYKGKKP